MSQRSFTQNYLEDSLASFRSYKKLAEKAIDQTRDDEFFLALDDESNSIAIVMKHMAGNMLSRWTDFLTSDGEKPDRNRDMEFVIDNDTTRQDVLDYWEKGWKCVFDAIEPLTPDDFEKTVTIRNDEHTIVQAINRQLSHYAYHIGQIVFLAKHFRTSEWKTLSIPRNKSSEFNAHMKKISGQKAKGETQMDTAGKFANDV